MGKSLPNCRHSFIPGILLMLLVILGFCNTSVYASESAGILQLNCRVQQNGSIVNLAGDTYAIAQIAKVNIIHATTIDYESCDGFEEFDYDWNSLTDEERQSVAKALQKQAEKLNLLAQGKKTNSDGTVKFDSLQPGLYLVVRTECSDKNQMYTADPFLVSIPTIVDGTLLYSITAVPKFEYTSDIDPEPVPDFFPDSVPDSATNSTSDTNSPKTGDYNRLELWICLFIVSVLGIVVVERYIQKKNK